MGVQAGAPGQSYVPRPRAAWGWRLLGWSLWAAGFVGCIWAFFLTDDGGGRWQILAELFGSPLANGGAWLLLLLSLLVFYVGSGCVRRADRLVAPSADRARASDPRAPVLYLRPFEVDGQMSRAKGGGAVATEEEAVARSMRRYGPFTAVGLPGEDLQPLGAARMQIADEEWRETVVGLMVEARLTILVAGRSPGFWWELEQAIRLVDPRRLLILLPFGSDAYDGFRREVADQIGLELPAFAGGSRTWTEVSALIRFDELGEAEMVPLGGSLHDGIRLLHLFVPFAGLVDLVDRRPTLTRALDRAFEEMGLARILEELDGAGPVTRPA